MAINSHSLFSKLLPALLFFYGGSALAFEPIKFDDGSVLDISLNVGYVNMKRMNAPVTMNDFYPKSSARGSVINATWPLKGNMWSPVVDQFTQVETKLNTDDGDLSVKKHGTISNRISGLLDVNLTKDDYRAFLRLNSFRDFAIYKNNDNYFQGTYNGVGPSNQPTEEAKHYLGQRTRLLDIYAQGRWKLGKDGGYPLTVKVGRQVVAWGEGLVFQGIGSSMNPNDQVKGMTPGIPAQEAFLPTEQIYTTLGVNDKLSLMAYWKWKFRPTETAPRGTYFAADDITAPGSTFQFALPYGALGLPGFGGYGAWRGPDIGDTPKGQWGVGGKYALTDQTEVGLYHLRYTDTVGLPEFTFGTDYWKLGKGLVSPDITKSNYDVNAFLMESVINALTPFNSTYNVRYMNDIKLTGASFSTMVGDYSVAGEIAYRDGAPIMMSDHHYALARGKLTNANLSALKAWSGGNFLWGITKAERAIIAGEIAVEHLHSFETPYYSPTPWQTLARMPRGPAEPNFDTNAVATVLRLELAYTPFPEWELSIPMFYFRQFVGNGAMQGGWNSGLLGKNSSKASIETKFTYKQNLELAMSLNYFLGDHDLRFHTFNPFADRDFVAFNAGYHF